MNAVEIAKAHVERSMQPYTNESKDLNKARAVLEEALTEQPHDTLLLTCYGAVLSDQGQHFAASRVLQKAVDLGSTDRNTFFNLGVASMNLEELRSSAHVWFERAKQSTPDDRSWEAYIDFQAY